MQPTQSPRALASSDDALLKFAIGSLLQSAAVASTSSQTAAHPAAAAEGARSGHDAEPGEVPPHQSMSAHAHSHPHPPPPARPLQKKPHEERGNLPDNLPPPGTCVEWRPYEITRGVLKRECSFLYDKISVPHKTKREWCRIVCSEIVELTKLVATDRSFEAQFDASLRRNLLIDGYGALTDPFVACAHEWMLRNYSTRFAALLRGEQLERTSPDRVHFRHSDPHRAPPHYDAHQRNRSRSPPRRPHPIRDDGYDRDWHEDRLDRARWDQWEHHRHHQDHDAPPTVAAPLHRPPPPPPPAPAAMPPRAEPAPAPYSAPRPAVPKSVTTSSLARTIAQGPGDLEAKIEKLLQIINRQEEELRTLRGGDVARYRPQPPAPPY